MYPTTSDGIPMKNSGKTWLIINHVLHMMAVVQLRTRTTEGRAYYDRKTAAGKRPNEAMRCMKRRLSDLIYRTMLDDVVTTSGTVPGGRRGASLISSAAGSQPHTDTSDQSLPGPVTHHDRTRPSDRCLTQKGASSGR